MAIRIKRKIAIKRFGKKKRFQKKMGLSRVPALRVPSITLKRRSFSSTWAFNTTTTNDVWRYYTFTAGDINNYSEFSALFDEYRINAVKVTFRPSYDDLANISGTGTLVQPQAYAHVCIDPSSTVIPAGTYTSANMNTFLENSGVRTYTLNRPFSVYLKPHVQDGLQGGGTASHSFKAPWIKTSDSAPIHRGFHMFLQQNSFSTGNTNIKLDTFYTFYLQFRNLK
jgi:hypothetical protein